MRTTGAPPRRTSWSRSRPRTTSPRRTPPRARRRARGAPCLTAAVGARELVIGPLYVPTATACWNCHRERVLAGERDRPATRALHDALLAGAPAASRRVHPSPAVPLAAQTVALEVVALLSEAWPPALSGRVLTLDLRSLQSGAEGVVPLRGARSAAAPRRWTAAGGGRSRTRAISGSCGPRWTAGSAVAAASSGTSRSRRSTPRRRCRSSPWLRWPRSAPAAAPCRRRPRGAAGLTPIAAARARPPRPSSATPPRCCAASCCCAPARTSWSRRSTPGDTLLFSPEQYARDRLSLRPARRRAAAGVGRARWLHNGAPVWVPAFAALLAYADADGGRPGARLLERCSPPPRRSSGHAAGHAGAGRARRAAHGLACGAGRAPARARRPPGRLLGRAGRAARARRRGRLLLEAGAGVPTVLCLALGEGADAPAVAAGLATRAIRARPRRPRCSRRRRYYPVLARLLREEPETVPARAEDVRTLPQHALYHAAPRERLIAFDALRGGRRWRWRTRRRSSSPTPPRSERTWRGAASASRSPT